MIDFAAEALTGKLAGEIESLAEAHSAEFTYWKEVKGPVDLDWARYFREAAINNLVVCTARDAGKLVGYFLIVGSYLAHFKTITQARDDTFYLAPEYRGSTIGFRFVAFAIGVMERTPAKILLVVNKVKADYRHMWEKLGFTAEEIHYTKVNHGRDI